MESSTSIHYDVRRIEFLTSWNGHTLFDQVNIPTGTNANDPVNSVPSTGWTNMQFTVQASGTNTVLQFGFQTGHSTNQFLLTEINLLPVTPTFWLQSPLLTGQTLNLSWGAVPYVVYQVQYTTNLSPPNWQNIGSPITAGSNNASAACSATNRQGYYRIVFQP